MRHTPRARISVAPLRGATTSRHDGGGTVAARHGAREVRAAMRHGRVLARSPQRHLLPARVAGSSLLALRDLAVSCVKLGARRVRSPSAGYLAAGTMAGAVDLSFSTAACLEARARGCRLVASAARTGCARVSAAAAPSPSRAPAFCRCSSWTSRARGRSCRRRGVPWPPPSASIAWHGRPLAARPRRTRCADTTASLPPARSLLSDRRARASCGH